jgi:hypothetical protein
VQRCRTLIGGKRTGFTLKKAFAAVIFLCVALSACGSKPSQPTTTSTTTSSTTTTTSTTPTTTPVTSRCHTDDLLAALANTEGAAGNVYYTFRLQNTSSRSCTLYGFVGMQPQDDAGTATPFVLTRQNVKPNRVTLESGSSATFVVQTEGSPAGECRSASTLLITPPDETTSLTLTSTKFQTCGRGAASIRPVGAN